MSLKMLISRVVPIVLSAFVFPSSSWGEVTSLFNSEHKVIRIPGGVSAVSWTPNGERIAVVTDFGQKIHILDKNGNVIKIIVRRGDGPAVYPYLVFINNSEFLFAPPEHSPASTALAVWNSETGVAERLIDGPQPSKEYSYNRADVFALCGPGDKLVTTSRVGYPNVVVIDLNDNDTRGPYTIDKGIVGLACSNSNLVARGVLHGTLALLNIDTGEVLYTKLLEDIPNIQRDLMPLAFNATGSELYVTEDIRFGRTWHSDGGAISGSILKTVVIRGVNVSVVDVTNNPLRMAAYVESQHELLAVTYHGDLIKIRIAGDVQGVERIPLDGQAYVVSYSLSSQKIAVGTSAGIEIFSANESN